MMEQVQMRSSRRRPIVVFEIEGDIYEDANHMLCFTPAVLHKARDDIWIRDSYVTHSTRLRCNRILGQSVVMGCFIPRYFGDLLHFNPCRDCFEKEYRRFNKICSEALR